MRLQVLFTLALVPALSAGCAAHVIRGGDPRPTALVPPGGPYALQLAPSVGDSQDLGHARIEDFRATLARGFYNALGSQATSDAMLRPTTLMIDECSLIREQVGYVGVLVARVRGRWLRGDGVVIEQFAGRVVPRNGLQSDGRRHLEDVIEVMYEKILAEYAQNSSQPRPQNGAIGIR